MALQVAGSGIAKGALVMATIAMIVGPLSAAIIPGPQVPARPEPDDESFVIGHVVVGNCTGFDGTGPFHLRVHAVNIGDAVARNVTMNVTVFVAWHDSSTSQTHPHSRTHEYGPIVIGDMTPMVWRIEEVLFDGGDCNMNHSSVDAEVAFAWG